MSIYFGNGNERANKTVCESKMQKIRMKLEYFSFRFSHSHAKHHPKWIS